MEVKQHEAISAIESRKDVVVSTTRFGRAVRITSIAVFMVTVGVAFNILQILTVPLRLLAPQISHELNSYVTAFAWNLCQYFVEGQDNVRLTLSGINNIPRGESAFVICNHAFFGDFFLIHSLARRKEMMSYCRYFLKDSIKYIPIFGWGMYLCNMPFLKRDWQRDSHRISRSLGSFINYKLPVWLVSHVEGSRLTTSKLEASHTFARNNNLPILKYVLLPRCKGFAATITALRGSHIKNVYDITVAYSHRDRGFCQPPSLFDILSGNLNNYQFHAHVDRIPIAEIPEGDEHSAQWLYDRYVQKDQLMGQIKEAFESKAKLKLN